MPGTPVVCHSVVTGLPLSGTDYNDNFFMLENALTDVACFVISGLTVSAGTGLSVNVASGEATLGASLPKAAFVIGGLTPSTTVHLYLNQDGTGSFNTSGTAPAKSCKLGTAVTGVSTVTSVNMGRTSGRQQWVQQQNLINGGPSAGTPSAGHPDALNLANWNVTDAEGKSCYGTLPAGAVTGMTKAVTTKTTNYTALYTDDVILCNTTGGSFTITLPTAVGHAGSAEFTIKKADSSGNVVHVQTTSAQTIDGLAPPHDIGAALLAMTFISDGSNYWAI